VNEQPNNEELERLLERLCLDALSAQECASLGALLADNPDAQRRYIEAVHLREGLAYLLSHGSAGAAPAQDLAAQPRTATQQPEGQHQRSIPSQAVRRGRFFHWTPSWATAACIAFLAGAALTLFATRGEQNKLANKNSEDVPRELLPASSSPASLLADNQLGKISGLSLEASADGLLRSMQVGQQLRCGEVVQLPTGFVHVQLDAGPELLFEGPAEFSLIGAESVFVRSGRLSAKGGARLLLQTPLLSAECLDARIAFEADDDDSAAIYVNEGVVTIAATPRDRGESQKLQVLHSGEGVVTEPAGDKNRLRVSDRGPLHGIVEDWSKVEERLSPYQRLILADRPLAYWPLHNVRKNRRVLDLTQNGHDGLPIGNWPSEVDAQQTDDSGRGVYFNGECYIEPDRKPPIKVESGFAVEGWAKPEGPPQYQAIFTSRWVLASHTPNQQCYGVTLYAGDTDRWEFWTGRGRHGDFWNVMESPETIDRSQWTHLAATFTPTSGGASGYQRGVARLYVNGKLSLEMDQETPLTDFDWPARIGAAEYVPRYLTSWLFKGYLADIAVYGYPLEAARVQEHYKAGQATAGNATSSHAPRSPWLFATIPGR
jgi:hypothetical protein